MTFTFLPNALGPPHLGHFYHVVVLRAVRDFYRMTYGRGGCADWPVRWELWSDFHQGHPVHFDQYAQMLQWMQMPPDATRHLQELGHDCKCSFVTKHEQEYQEHSPTAYKLFGFDFLEVRHVVRAATREMFDMAVTEHDMARCIGLNYPSVHYSPVLNDEDGKPIEAHTASGDYHLDFTMPFESVFNWFLETQMIVDEGWPYIPSAPPEEDGKFDHLHKVFNLLRPGKAHFDLAKVRNNVPRNWKDQV
jgi:hypothetical protein